MNNDERFETSFQPAGGVVGKVKRRCAKGPGFETRSRIVKGAEGGMKFVVGNEMTEKERWRKQGGIKE